MTVWMQWLLFVSSVELVAEPDVAIESGKPVGGDAKPSKGVTS